MKSLWCTKHSSDQTINPGERMQILTEKGLGYLDAIEIDPYSKRKTFKVEMADTGEIVWFLKGKVYAIDGCPI